MRSAKLFLALFAAIICLYAVAATASTVDMNDPRRALGREDDIRIDAQLLHDTVSSGAPISVTYQVQNLTAQPVALAPRTSDASYDAETQTITVSIGSEVPDNGNLPALVMIGPGEKKTFTVAATPLFQVAAIGSPFQVVPRLVQVKVTILRELAPFGELIAKQARAATPPLPLSDELFDRWLESNDTILLNTIPVRYEPKNRGAMPSADASARAPRRF